MVDTRLPCHRDAGGGAGFPSRTITIISPAPPEGLTAFIKSEEPKWRKIITDAKIKVE